MTTLTKRTALPLAALLAVLLGAFTALPAFAQAEISPDTLALARKYVELTDKSGIFEATIVQAGLDSYNTLIAQNPTMADQLNTAIGKVVSTYKGQKGDLFDRFARVYALSFSKDELQQIVDFYSSPVGQKLATANSTLAGSLADVMNVYKANLGKEFLAKVRTELKAAGIDM